MSESNPNKEPIRKFRIPKDYLQSVSNYEQFLTKDGKFIPEVQLLLYLMRQLGVRELATNEDYEEFAFRYFTAYGSQEVMENLFLRNEFLSFYHMDYYEVLEQESSMEHKYDHCKIHGRTFVVDFQLLSSLRGLCNIKHEWLTRDEFLRNQKLFSSQWATEQRKSASGFKIYRLYRLEYDYVHNSTVFQLKWAHLFSERVVREIESIKESFGRLKKK